MPFRIAWATVVLVGVTIAACAGEAPSLPCADETCVAEEAEANAQYIRDNDIATFATDLARAGRFAAARAALMRVPAPRPGDLTSAAFRWRSAASAIVLRETAAAAWAHPDEIASYDAFDKLASASGRTPSDYESASRYWLLAKRIIERFEPELNSPELTRILRKRVVRHGRNATLDDLLQSRWPQAIEKLPERKQGDLWNYVADIHAEMDHTAAAEEMLDRAEQRGGYDFHEVNRIYVSTTQSWLRLGKLDRALNAARQTPPDAQVQIKNFVAQALLKANRREMARAVFEEAEADFENVQNKSGHIGLLAGIAQGFRDFGDLREARKVADRVLEVARLPAILPAGQLAAAARAYNDIGDHARAIALLQEAVSKIPDPHKVIAFGPVSGPISGSTLGVGDSMRSEIAREFYHAGDKKSFDEQFVLLSPEYQNTLQRWRARQELGDSHPQRSPSLDLYFSTLAPADRTGAALELAVDAIDDGETDAARKLLRRALDDFADGKRPLTYTAIAKVAFAGGFPGLVAAAVHEAAAAALRIDDRGTRAGTLATVAAFRHELGAAAQSLDR
jgi:tetratricopeptide (TPR) repeat protein